MFTKRQFWLLVGAAALSWICVYLLYVIVKLVYLTVMVFRA